MKVLKRDGSLVEFNQEKIANAIYKSALEVNPVVSWSFAEGIASAVTRKCEKRSQEEELTVEMIQDMVEDELLVEHKDIAKRYIIFREEKKKKRPAKKKYKYLSDEFLSKYKHRRDPLNQIGSFVFYRTYSRFLHEEGRREYWWEALARAVDYNCSLIPETTREEAEELYDNIYNLKQQLSGRTLYTGGTEASLKYPLSNFNCSFLVVESIDNLCDLIYVLMVGTGAGVNVKKQYVEKLPSFRTDIQVHHEEWEFTDKEFREDITTTEVNGDTLKIIVGDSKEGFVEALRIFLQAISYHSYRTIKNIIINYNYVRPKGEVLMTFGGTASGHETIKMMFHKIYKVIRNRAEKPGDRVKLESIDVLDIANLIGDNVVSGGVRRTAEIIFIDSDDEESKSAKSAMNYIDENGNWQSNSAIAHRSVSNNSIIYDKKPSREELHKHFQIMKNSGEPGFINAEAARKRRADFMGTNPCGEILLYKDGVCNLTTVNVYAFVREDGTLDRAGLMNAIRLSTRAGYRMTNVTLELYNWDRIQKRDRLLGISMTGYQDAVYTIGMSLDEQAELLREMREMAHKSMKEIAKESGGKESLLVTTIKPEGTLSWVMGGVSQGLHFQHAKHYIRRIRINSDDALVKVAEDLGWPIYPEVGQDWETCTTKVVEFPIKSTANRFKKDVSAVEQLEIYKMFQKNYTDHNSSITVDIWEHEWDEAEEWIWNNWDDFVGISFLQRDTKFYKLLPFEDITEEEYNARIEKMEPFNPILLKKYETGHGSELDANETCADGACGVR